MLEFELSFDADPAEAARVPFSGTLGVAEFDGHLPPDRTAFEPVEGFNLSHTGISFAAPVWPATDRLIVALGDDRCPVLVSARVIACSRRADQGDAPSYEVQCEFDQWHT